MKKLQNVWMLLMLVVLVSACGSSRKVVVKEDLVAEKLAELTAEGWKIHGASYPLRWKLEQHYNKMDANPNLVEQLGTSTGCRSITVCRASAINAASMEIASKMGQKLKGRTLRDLGLNEASATSEEYNKFQQACIGAFEESIKGELEESFSLIKPKAGGDNDYEIYFVFDKKKAESRSSEAMKAALEASKLREEYRQSVQKSIEETHTLFE